MSFAIEIRPAREAIARKSGFVHVAVRAVPEPAGERRPVALALVVDASGSMSEAAGHGSEGRGAPAKMRFVKEAAHFLVGLLDPDDQLAVVAFSESAQAILPAISAGDGGRVDIHAAIERLQPGGGTNLEAGLRLGCDLLAGARVAGTPCRLVLLSDGDANQGETRPDRLAAAAEAASREGITVSTVGVGLGFNSELLRALADAGGGEMHHVESPRSSEAALTAELYAAGEVTARNVEVELRVPAPATIAAKNLNDYPEEAIKGGVRVRLGDLARPREVVFEVSTPVAMRGAALKLEAKATCRDSAGAAQEAEAKLPLRLVTAEEANAAGHDPDVMALVFRLLQARAETEISLRMEAGDAQGAVFSLDHTRAEFGRVKFAYGAAAALASAPMEQELDELEQKMTSGHFDRNASKAAFMKGQAGRRSGGAVRQVPFERSYWVTSKLLAGCYPGDLVPTIAHRKVTALVDCGVTTIVNLMRPGEKSHGGAAFVPYDGAFAALQGEVRNHPISDGGIPTRVEMKSILDAIDAAIASSGKVYVHCWGGRGRTGTVVGCWLIRHRVAVPDHAVQHIQRLRAGTPDAHLESPETRQQVAFVQGWPAGE